MQSFGVFFEFGELMRRKLTREKIIVHRRGVVTFHHLRSSLTHQNIKMRVLRQCRKYEALLLFRNYLRYFARSITMT